MKRLLMLAVVVLLLQLPANAFAAAGSMYIAPGGKGVFYLTGENFVDVGGVEVEIQYDTTTLANPRIVQGPLLASTMFIPNPSFKANSVKIAAMSLAAIKGSGVLAVITFDLKGDKAGPVNIIQRKLVVAAAGTKVPDSQAPITSGGSGGSFGSDSPAPSTRISDSGGGSAGSSGSSSVAGIAMGTISLPSDPLASGERRTEAQPLITELRKDLAMPTAGAEAAAAARAAKAEEKEKAAENRYETYNGALELFQLYKGERSEKALLALFAAAEIPDFVQTPLVAMADGKTPLKIVLKLKTSGSEPPKFIAQGANIKQLSAGEEESSWIIEAVPRKGVVKARLTVIDGGRMFDYPLTVAPPIDPQLLKGKKLSAEDFKLYLAKPPKYDWNGDGKFDELDDFIYTANYIAALNLKPVKGTSAVKPEKGGKEDKPEKSGKEDKPAKGSKEELVEKSATEVKEKGAAPGKEAPARKEPAPKAGKGKVKKGEKSRPQTAE